MDTFLNHKAIADLVDILDTIDDDRTVIVAPSYGNSKKETRPSKLRVYSYGGHVLDLSTTKANNDLFPDKGYDQYFEGLKMGSFPYKELNKETLWSMIEAARRRAAGESTDDSKKAKEYKERSAETRLIKRNRESGYGNGIVIDMEFCAPKEWVEPIATYKGKSTTGKPDLVIYDKETKSFGIVELKLNNDSTDNMDKHFTDFYNMIHSKDVMKIKEEFCRRMRYLMEYGLIEEIDATDLETARNNPIWNAFLFICGDAAESRRIFDEAPIDTRFINRKEVGYQYIPALETNIDYSKNKFFQYLNG